MKLLAVVAGLLAAVDCESELKPNAKLDGGVVGGYLMLQRSDPATGQIVGLRELKAVAENAKTIPINRIWVSFFDPTLVYEKGSKSFKMANLGISDASDGGFGEVKSYLDLLKAGGVEVFLSMGGWNYNCFPALYARYSVGGYGTQTPNYWKIQQYGNGNIDNCNEANQWCYVCEPPSEHTTLKSFAIFPQPDWSPTWQAAQKKIEAGAGSPAPQWVQGMVPGQHWTDSKTGTSLLVPGNGTFATLKRDPYADFVQMAADLGVAGIDIDYEEFWMADYYKTTAPGGQASTGPWQLDQCVYKYACILADVIANINTIAPGMKLSTAASAVGGWAGKWWGGNLKGVWLQVYQKYPDLIKYITDSQGLNIMSYDLSSNPTYHECPEDGICALDQQVDYYMKTYETAGMDANVGYEVGTPAYPPPDHDPSHQLPLTTTMLASIVGNTQKRHTGGFQWELYKPADSASNADATAVAQAVCKVVLGDATRCSGVVPPMAPAAPTPPTPPTVSPPPTPPPPTPATCGTWVEICNTCSDCIQCKADPSKFQCP